MGAAGVLFVGGLLFQHSAQRRQVRAQAKRLEAEKNISIIKQKREKRNQLRRARATQAEIQAQGIAQGGSVTDPSSAVSGAVGGVQSQYAYNLSFLDQVSAQNQIAFQASQEANVFGAKARTAGAVASTASKFIKT